MLEAKPLLINRSSIIKTGWILANNIGIIDPGYTGELKIALIKINPDAQELTVPFCKTQLICRKIIKAEVEITEEILEKFLPPEHLDLRELPIP